MGNILNEAIRNPTNETAQNVWQYVTPDEAEAYIPNIVERLDSESSEQVASDTLFSVIDIVENQLNGGIDAVFNSGILERISTMVLNILNNVAQRASEILIG